MQEQLSCLRVTLAVGVTDTQQQGWTAQSVEDPEAPTAGCASAHLQKQELPSLQAPGFGWPWPNPAVVGIEGVHWWMETVTARLCLSTSQLK